MENTNNNRGKRFYKKGEIVWVVSELNEGEILSIDTTKQDVLVKTKDKELTLKLWEIDKLKYLPKKKMEEKEKNKVDSYFEPTVYFAKVKEDAIIPTKREEDAGFDFFANFEGNELLCKKGQTTLVPTGIAVAMPNTHYMNLKHERGSTSKLGMSMLAGVVDSGYRGEIFVAISPLNKDIVISKAVDKVSNIKLDYTTYPYSDAICQATIEIVPKVKPIVISFEELQSIDSERGTNKLGSTNK